jgi:uncharacterized damage-inducible protein DinB
MKSNKILEKLVEENLSHLANGIDILSLVSSEHYIFAESSSSSWMSGIGKHFRHLIDFYDRFVYQFPNVNYDLRERNVEIETNKDAAKERIVQIKNLLLTFKQKDIDEEIVLFQGDIPMNENNFKVKSNLGRELRYLVEHTVHHYAIIAMFLKKFGYSVPIDFGLARSTLEYEAKQI